jgi:uroporphyrinogen decarboxylase
LDQVTLPDVEEHLGYVFEAVRMTKSALNDRVPLIGFAGAPWTLLCYAVQGQGSKNFDRAKAFCFQEPEMAKELLQRITTTTIAYLREKVKAGADVIQLFDSWGGLLSPDDYQEFSWPYLQQIVDALSGSVPVIVFGKGCWFALQEMTKSGASALGIDWTCSARNARYLSGGQITLQGNFDPSRLLSPIHEIKTQVKQMINAFGKDRYIVNLGHGILPNIPVDHAKAFVDAVKEYQS